jgi:hypothetical protein
MIPIVGIFRSRNEAERGASELHGIGISTERITIVTPQVAKEELESVPTSQGEQPGMFKALGAVVGGVVGAGVVEALSTMLVPGVGVVMAIGVTGGILLGVLTGGAIGDAAEKSIFGVLPEQELFVYTDALRKGRTVVIAMAGSELQAKTARGALEREGAESIDSARNMWWIGLRDVEKEEYQGVGGNFEQDERYFRSGFEAALHPENRGKSYEEARRLKTLYPGSFDHKAFRRGYVRGRAYLENLGEEQKGAPW